VDKYAVVRPRVCRLAGAEPEVCADFRARHHSVESEISGSLSRGASAAHDVHLIFDICA